MKCYSFHRNFGRSRPDFTSARLLHVLQTVRNYLTTIVIARRAGMDLPLTITIQSRTKSLAKTWREIRWEYQSVRPRQAEDMLGQVGQDQIGRDRSDLVQARFTEFALNIILRRETKPPVGLQAHVRRLP